MNKIIEAFDRGYVVSLEGKAYNKNGKEVGFLKSNGRAYFKIRIKGLSTDISVHRLQAFQKYGHQLFNNGIEVRHLDAIPSNNSWDNIAIGTHSQNMMDIPEQIRISKAIHASTFNKKYNEKEVLDFHNKEKSYKKTMEKFSISSKGTLNYILKGRK